MDELTSTDIAIVGMALRVPGASTPEELWNLVRKGDVAIRRLSREEMLAAGVPSRDIDDPDYVPYWGGLEDAGEFDAGLFGIGARDAALMDPQHRKFLECAWEALEGAGHPPDRFGGSVGVFAGCGLDTYLLNNLLPNEELVDSVGMFLLRHTGNDKDFMPTTLSYRLNLKGPSVSVQTACSTSLVAVHMASQSLIAGECDLALAGGSTIQVPLHHGYHYREGEILSPDGYCRAFDKDAKGTVLTSGVGVVALRRLADALEDGDYIHAGD